MRSLTGIKTTDRWLKRISLPVTLSITSSRKTKSLTARQVRSSFKFVTWKSRAILPKKPLTIIEGSYACHPHFEIDSKIANRIKVYLECDRADQKQRILLRNGENMLKRFVGEWIPMENEYNNKFGIRAKSDFIIQT